MSLRRPDAPTEDLVFLSEVCGLAFQVFGAGPGTFDLFPERWPPLAERHLTPARLTGERWTPSMGGLDRPPRGS